MIKYVIIEEDTTSEEFSEPTFQYPTYTDKKKAFKEANRLQGETQFYLYTVWKLTKLNFEE